MIERLLEKQLAHTVQKFVLNATERDLDETHRLQKHDDKRENG